jgi:hypothetical protein
MVMIWRRNKGVLRFVKYAALGVPKVPSFGLHRIRVIQVTLYRMKLNMSTSNRENPKPSIFTYRNRGEAIP